MCVFANNPSPPSAADCMRQRSGQMQADKCHGHDESSRLSSIMLDFPSHVWISV